MMEENANSEDAQKSKKEYNYYELLKYPIITVCIVLGLIAVSNYTGIDFKRITKLSAEGIEFAALQTNAILDLDDSIAILQSQVAFLMQQQATVQESPSDTTGLRSSSPGSRRKVVWTETPTEALKRTEMVNKSIGRLGLANPNQASLKGQTGYIWLGEYKNSWKPDTLLMDPEKSMMMIESAPGEIKKQLYVLDKSIKLRSEPSSSSKMLGVIPEKTKIYLNSVESTSNNQYWAKVEVEP